ncbi:MAG: hypothetical protein U0M06_11400 [Clostridia bacterium]|nr:hypothetical protein [Clostridia bacterium]
MKKVAFFIFLVLLFSFVSCSDTSGKVGDSLAYQENSFEAVAEVVSESFTTTVKVICGKWQKESGTERDIKLIFIAPETISGLEIERSRGVIKLSMLGQSFEDTEGKFEDAFKFCELFSIKGPPVSFKVEGKNTRVCAETENGETSLLLDSKGFPIEIKQGDILIRVKDFKPT